MCGIVGILGFSDAFPLDEAIVTRMRDTLTHRGPDDAGTLVRSLDRIGLGHRRLSIVDLSSAGHQPMSNEDETLWITYNGEVYNHLALRAELEEKGHSYTSRTDTETVLHLYEEEGPRCLERLEGMFAFAIWDARRHELFLARDRVGVKPLYYAHLPGGFVFGSEAKAILAHPAVTADLDEEAFWEYLTFAFTPPPRTMYHGVGKLGAAEQMVVRSDGSTERSTWWDPLASEASREVRSMSEAEMVAELRRLLQRSIEKRMMADVPFGVFLSGGLDSASNVALMAPLSQKPVRTYSTAPAGHARYDELRYARLVAERFGTDHHEVIVEEQDMRNFLPRLLYHQDEPNADWTAIPQHFVSELARNTGTIVVQVGEGSDELLHGYRGYVDHRRWVVPFQRWVPRPARALLGRGAVRVTTALGRGIRHGEAIYDAGHSSIPYWGGDLCFRGPLKAQIAVNGSPHPDAYRRVEDLWAQAAAAQPDVDLFQRMTYVELRQRLPELLLTRLDRIAMASSVEGREPFLDHQLVEFALALPPAVKYRNGAGKWALREAMSGVLPAEILTRPKQGFGTPMEEWLRADFGRRAHAAVRGSSLAERGLLDYDRIDQIFAAHKAGRGDWSKHIWNLYAVSAWHDIWVSGRGFAAEQVA
jgi:asparagine synthase (glutamine-hydrolysing)